MAITESVIARSNTSRRQFKGLVEDDPDTIEVKNALSDDVLIHDFSAEPAEDDCVSVNNLMYLLQWGNSLRVNTGESHFDVPNSEALFKMMVVYTASFGVLATNPQNSEKTVPLLVYQYFLNQFDVDDLPDRRTIMSALDEFVGRHM